MNNPVDPGELAAQQAADLARRAFYRELRVQQRTDLLAGEIGAGSWGNWLAAALGDALLAAPTWTTDDLCAAAVQTVGDFPWLPDVVRDVLEGYPLPPADRPRELGRYVARLRSFREHVRGAPGARPGARRIRVQVRTAVPVRMVRAPFHTPRIDDVRALADFLGLTIEQLDWYADRRDLNRRVADTRLEHYRYLWLNGRLIEAPKPRLKQLQRRLLDEVLGPIPIHLAAHGFVPGRGPHTFATPHAGQPMVVRLDVTSFFAAITAARVYGIFRTAGFAEPVAHTLAGLCTTRTPNRVRLGAPAGVPDRGYRLALLAAAHLPQGAPTSPALANLGGFRLDRRLAGLAAKYGAEYTRYADDLAFSGDLSIRAAQALAGQVTEIAREEGFRINVAKTRVRGPGDRQQLAGLVVNEQPAVPREEYDRLRALLHNAARTGLDEQNRDGHPDFRAHVAGRIAWVGHRQPRRAAKLAALLAQI